jgi:hypothetical protein
VQTRKVNAEVVLTAVGKVEDYDLPCMLFSSVNPATWDDEFIFSRFNPCQHRSDDSPCNMGVAL